MSVYIPDVSRSQRSFTKASRQLKLEDLLWLSTVSKKHYKRAKKALQDSYRFAWLAVELTLSPTMRFFPSDDEDDLHTEFHFYNLRHPEWYGMKGQKTRRIQLYNDGSTERSLVCWEESHRQFGVASDSIEDVIHFVKHLEVLFTVTTNYLTIAPQHIHHLKKIQSIEMLKRSNYVSIAKGTISHATFRRVMTIPYMPRHICPPQSFIRHIIMPVCIPDVSLSQRAFTEASRQLKLEDLFWLSTVSKKHYKRVKNAISDGCRYAWLEVELTSSPTVEFAPNEDEDDLCTEFNFYNRRHPERYGMEGQKTRNICMYVGGSTERSLVCWKESHRQFGVASDSIEDVIQFVKHLEVLFMVSTNNLTIAPEHLHHLKKIQSIEMLRRSNCVSITKGTVSLATFRRVMNGFTSSSVAIECNIESKVDFDKIRIPDSSLCINNSSLIDISMIPKLYNVRVFMNNCKMNNLDVNSFLCQWKKSSEGKLWVLRLWKNHEDKGAEGVYDDFWNQEKWDFKKIIDGLEDTLVQPQNYSELDERCPSGYLQRKTDAMMMKITVDFSDRSCTKLTIESDYSYVRNVYFSRVKQPEYVENDDSEEEEEEEEEEAGDDVNMASENEEVDSDSEESSSSEDDNVSMNSEVEEEAEEHGTSSENDDASMSSEVEDDSEEYESDEDSEDDDDSLSSDDDLFDMSIDE